MHTHTHMHKLQLSLNLWDSPRFLASVPHPGRLHYNCIIGLGRGPDTGMNTVVVIQLITYVLLVSEEVQTLA